MTRPIRPGDQPLPSPATGPGMHDLVIADLRGRDGTIWPLVIADLEDRRDLGLLRYGQPLQSGNGRDALRDLTEELLDATAYARQVRVEAGSDDTRVAAELVENRLLDCLALTQTLRLARSAAVTS